MANFTRPYARAGLSSRFFSMYAFSRRYLVVVLEFLSSPLIAVVINVGRKGTALYHFGQIRPLDIDGMFRKSVPAETGHDAIRHGVSQHRLPNLCAAATAASFPSL